MKTRLALAGTAAVLVAAVLAYLAARAPRTESPAVPPPEPRPDDVASVETALASPDPAAAPTLRSSVAEEASADAPTTAGADVLRVVVEGITEEEARRARVTLAAYDERQKRIAEIRGSWLCQGSTTDFDLDPLFGRAAERRENLRVHEMRVEVDHPEHLLERVWVSLAGGVERRTGQTVHEIRVRLTGTVFWPGFTLAVRDAHTHAHLEDVELRITPGAGNAMWGSNPRNSLLADGLSSPIELMGGREADDERVAGMALAPAAGESPRLVELSSRRRLEQAVVVSARAPGYAWGSIALDVSNSHEHELLLKPGSALDVQLANVQLERYAALGAEPMLCIYWIREDGGNQIVRFEPLEETLATEGLRLEGLAPGGYRVGVELDGEAWTKRPVLALEERSVVAGETAELVLALADPPAPAERATLGGVISFPHFGGEEDVQLTFYEVGRDPWGVAPAQLSLADLERVGGVIPTWSFRVEDQPVGLYQIELTPLQKSWMIELPAGGREDVELVIPELAEVIVETVDARTGERIPAPDLKYGTRVVLPGQVHDRFGWAHLEAPGRFRIWTVPGAAYVQTNRLPVDYGWRRTDLELLAGLQSVRFELEPACYLRFEFRVDGVVPRLSDGIEGWIRYGPMKSILAVDHGGRALSGDEDERVVEVTAPGVYEIRFEGLTADRFHPVPPRRVHVHAGELTEVTVELERK